MPRRRQRLLPLFALALVAFLATALPLVAGAGVGTAAAATLEPLPPYEPKPAPAAGELAAAHALRMVGVPYHWGGASPEVGFDCSGLVYWAYEEVGITVPHSSYTLYTFGKKVSLSRLKPGDVLFFDGLGHVGLYLGGGRMVHAPETGRNVEVVRLARSHYGDRIVGARRMAAA
jgi:cell wall-associated NlpC family hydrolase